MRKLKPTSDGRDLELLANLAALIERRSQPGEPMTIENVTVVTSAVALVAMLRVGFYRVSRTHKVVAEVHGRSSAGRKAPKTKARKRRRVD